MMAGVMLLILGLTGLGSLVKFIPRPVTIGFTNGIAVLIASTQIKDFFGLKIDKVPGDFVGRMQAVCQPSPNVSRPRPWYWPLASVVVILFFRRFVKRVPGSIVALVAATVVVVVWRLPVESIGTRFGGIPSGLPTLACSPRSTRTRSPTALAGVDGRSARCDRVADVGRRLGPHERRPARPERGTGRPRRGQYRLAAVWRHSRHGGDRPHRHEYPLGRQTPVAGMIHALTLLAILLFAAPLAQYIPLAVLAAILMVVSYNMGEWSEIPKILTMTWADISVWLVTFALTVFADLSLAVEVGMLLAAWLYIHKVTRTTTVSKVTREYVEEGRLHILQDKPIPDYVTVFRIHGPFLFGATEKVQEIVDEIDSLAPIVILRLRNMTAIDATGLLTLEELATSCTRPTAA